MAVNSRFGEVAEVDLGEATTWSVTAKPLLYEVVPTYLEFELNTAYVLFK